MAQKSPFHRLAEWAEASPAGAREIRMETGGQMVKVYAVTWVKQDGKEPRGEFVINAYAFTRVDGNLVSALQRAASRCIGQLTGAHDPT